MSETSNARAPIALASALALLCLATVAAVTAVAGAGGASFASGGNGSEFDLRESPSTLAVRDIPRSYLGLYARAGRAYDLDWAVIAAIGKVECDHGRAPDASCTRAGAVNQAGAGGPMQFLASTWARYGRDVNGDGTASRWDPADAIYAAAAYLRASGAPRDYASAIFAYNHARAYVARVEEWAARYRASEASGAVGAQARAWRPEVALAGESATAVVFVEGPNARLAPGDGHVALVPAATPPAVQALVVAGNELQDLPYGPAGHPDPRGAMQADCSSTVNYVLWRAGLRGISEILRENPLAQDYTGWGAPGPGRWVTIYSTRVPAPHVFIVIAGLRLDTSHAGTDSGPNRAEGGPRWRVFDGIPTWARWSVRHPPGL